MLLNLGEQKIQLAGPAGELETLVRVSEDAKGVAVCCHPHPLHGGTLTNKVVHTLHRIFQQRDLHTLRFNFRGVGKSEGSYADGDGEVEDLKAVLEWVQQQWPELEITLAGFSFGAFISLKAASDFPIRCLVSVAPPVDRFYFNDLIVPDYPWIVIQPMADEVVDAKAVVNWFESLDKQQSRLIKIENASHFFHGKLIELKEKLNQMMDEMQL